MPLFQGTPLQLPSAAQRSGNNVGFPAGFVGELVVSEFLAKYATLVKAGVVFSAYAALTAPVIYTTAAGTGGPLIWNKPGSGLDAHVLAVSFGSLSAATSVAGSLGLTGNSGQNVAPTATTAIDATGSMYVGGSATGMGGVYRVGTPANAGAQYFPLVAVGTGAITIKIIDPAWVDVGGAFIIPPGAWGSIAANATLTAGVVGVGMIWAELPA